MRWKVAAVLFVSASCVLPAFAQLRTRPAANASPSAEQSCLAKVRHIQQNGTLAHPDQTPTVFSEAEVNACFASDQVKLPAGLEAPKFNIQTGHVSARMNVNFDQLARRSSNPLLGLFSGTHLVEVQAHGEGSGGIARAHIDTVSLDGSEVPRFLLRMFIEKMLQPKYPQASLDPVFKMPDKVDLVLLGDRRVTLTQK